MRLFLHGRCFPILGVFLLVAASCEPALARGYGEGSTVPFVDNVIDWLGFYDVAADKADLLTICLVVYAFFFGIFTHLALKDRGFGSILNGVVGVVGICLALFACGPKFHLLPSMQEQVRFNVVLIACGLGSAVFLVAAAFFKGIAVRLLTQFLDLFDQPARPAPVKVESLSPRVSAALRKS